MNDSKGFFFAGIKEMTSKALEGRQGNLTPVKGLGGRLVRYSLSRNGAFFVTASH